MQSEVRSIILITVRLISHILRIKLCRFIFSFIIATLHRGIYRSIFQLSFQRDYSSTTVQHASHLSTLANCCMRSQGICRITNCPPICLLAKFSRKGINLVSNLLLLPAVSSWSSVNDRESNLSWIPTLAEVYQWVVYQWRRRFDHGR